MFGVDGPADTHTPIRYARLTVQPGSSVAFDMTAGHTAALYAFEGSATVGPDGRRLDSQQLAVFDRSSGDVVLAVDACAASPLDAIVLTGEPLAEPVARYGPFVMNTRAEIVEAIDDFNAGRMGTIPPAGHA